MEGLVVRFRESQFVRPPESAHSKEWATSELAGYVYLRPGYVYPGWIRVEGPRTRIRYLMPANSANSEIHNLQNTVDSSNLS